MKIESLAISAIKWGVILPIVGSCIMAIGVVVYAIAMIIDLGAAEVDVTTLRQ